MVINICSECHVGWLEDHPELIYFSKCPICAYSCIKLNLSEQDKVKAKLRPFMTHSGFEALKATYKKL